MFIITLLAAAVLVPNANALQPVPCYGYKKDSVVVEWTAFKFTEKTPVKGRLKNVQTRINGAPQTQDEMILSTSFEIDAMSVDSGDPARDINLKEHFFKHINSPKIVGKVVSLASQIVRVELQMNGVTKPVEFKLTTNTDAKISAVGIIDVVDFSMNEALKKINEACFELHKGKDGVSKTWSTVELTISAEPMQTCKKGK